MKRVITAAVFAALAVFWCSQVLAIGPHDMDCMECHSTHYAKADYLIAVEPDTRMVNPATTRVRMTPAEIDSLCLGCHNDDMGIMPVNLSTTHPTGVKPARTPVPQELLWDGVFVCTSCHDPHPSNPNARYLIVQTEQDGMGVFCAQCHPQQTDPDVMNMANGVQIRNDPAHPPIVSIETPAAPQQ